VKFGGESLVLKKKKKWEGKKKKDPRYGRKSAIICGALLHMKAAIIVGALIHMKDAPRVLVMKIVFRKAKIKKYTCNNLVFF
jgi:hypothetical protein